MDQVRASAAEFVTGQGLEGVLTTDQTGLQNNSLTFPNNGRPSEALSDALAKNSAEVLKKLLQHALIDRAAFHSKAAKT